MQTNFKALACIVVIVVGASAVGTCQSPTSAPPLVDDKVSATAAKIAAPAKQKPLAPLAPPKAPAKPTLTLPDSVTIEEANDPKLITAVTNGKVVRWYAVTKGLRVITKDVAALGDCKSVYVWGDPGTYKLIAYTALGDISTEPVLTTVTIGPEPPVTPPIPTVVPSLETQAAMLPVKSIMAVADKAKARIWAGAWTDFLTKLSANPPLTIGSFDAAVNAYGNQVGTSAGLILAFPGLSDATDAAFTKLLGKQDGPLDKAKATDFIIGLIWSCGL